LVTLSSGTIVAPVPLVSVRNIQVVPILEW
jgi:hypothetical protein